MKEFTVMYKHKSYGYYTTNINAESILKALQEFKHEYAHVEIYGIIEVR